MTVLAFSDLMTALSAELSRLSEATERMHDLVCADPRGRRQSDARFVEDAQRIDHTVQVLADLAQFLTNLAGETPAEGRLRAGRALASLRLAELQHRLASAAGAPVQPAAVSGEFELF